MRLPALGVIGRSSGAPGKPLGTPWGLIEVSLGDHWGSLAVSEGSLRYSKIQQEKCDQGHMSGNPMMMVTPMNY